MTSLSKNSSDDFNAMINSIYMYTTILFPYFMPHNFLIFNPIKKLIKNSDSITTLYILTSLS